MEYDFITSSTLMSSELFSIFGLNKNINIDFNILYNSLIQKSSYGLFLNSMFKIEKKYDELYKYSILFNYKDKYTAEEIQKISKIFNIIYTDEDYQNRNNIIYYLDKLYFSLYYNYYNSLDYEEILKIFIL